MPDVPERKPILSERTVGRMFDFYMAPEVEHLFADGTGRAILGQLTKLELYRVIGLKQEVHGGIGVNVEEREIFCVLTIPTVPLVETIGVLIDQLGNNMPLFDAAHEQLKGILRNAIRQAAAVKV